MAKKIHPMSVAPSREQIRFLPKKFKFTARQRSLLETTLNPDARVLFVSGPAGSSKTYMAVYSFLQLMSNDIEKTLLYVRSIAESADHRLGSLPGDINDKFDPFLIPLEDKLIEIVQPGDQLELKQKERITAMPINFIRGAHWTDMLVIADEAQNFTRKELTTLITRIGPNSKLIICGDMMQSDINGKSGFSEMFDLFDDEESREEGLFCHKFTARDIVRDDILKFIIKKLETLK